MILNVFLVLVYSAFSFILAYAAYEASKSPFITVKGGAVLSWVIFTGLLLYRFNL